MRHNYSEETKAAVMAALLSGQSVGQVAREYHIPKGTVSGWKKVAIPNDATQKKDIGVLLLAYLETNLETLRAQAEHFRDFKWLTKQNAADLAVLHGVMTDKAIRLLEAMSNANSRGKN